MGSDEEGVPFEDSDDEDFDKIGSLLAKLDKAVVDVKDTVGTTNGAVRSQIMDLTQTLQEDRRARLAAEAEAAAEITRSPRSASSSGSVTSTLSTPRRSMLRFPNERTPGTSESRSFF